MTMTQPTHTDLQRDFGKMKGRMDALDRALIEVIKRTKPRVIIANGDVFDGGIYTRPVEPARLVKWSQVKARRDEVIDGGAPVPGLGTFDSDMLSRINITGAVTLAQISGQSFSISWTLADNTVVQLNAAQMIGVGAAVGQFVAAAHANAQALRADIEAAQDFAELEAIDIGAGWP